MIDFKKIKEINKESTFSHGFQLWRPLRWAAGDSKIRINSERDYYFKDNHCWFP